MTRVLVLGAGLIGARHAQAVAAHAQLQLAGVVDPDATLHTEPNTTYFTSLNDVDVPVDAVIIATPTPLHAEHGIAAATRGWHMLIEKPVTETLDEAHALIAAVRAAGVRTLVGHHRRYHPSVQHMREMIQGGALGTPITATVIWAMRKPDSYFEDNWRAAHGSPVMVNLVHDLDLLRDLFGEVADVHALSSRHIRGTHRPESGAIALRFHSGVTAAISFADTAPSPWGFEAGTAENPNIATTGQDMMWITCSEGAVSFPSMTVWHGARDWSEAPEPTHLSVPDIRPLDAQLDHFHEVITGAAEPRISVEDATATLATTLTIEEAIRAPERKVAHA